MWCKYGVNIHHLKLQNVVFMWAKELKMYNTLKTYYVYQTTPYDLTKKAEKHGI
jgi:homoserine trans-succinylase